MELDEIKAAWQAIDRRLEQQHTLNLQLFREHKLKSARRALRPLQTGQWIQIAAGLGLTLLVAPFWVNHRMTPHLMLPALLTHAYALMLIILAARLLTLIARVDYAEPVIQLQRSLAEIRLQRTRVEQPMLAFAGCFLWVLLTLLAFNALGVDIWLLAPNFVYWLVASGLAGFIAVYGFLWWVRKSGGQRIKAAVENSFAGRSLRNAQTELAELARFEQE
jgi:hypothetical protein